MNIIQRTDSEVYHLGIDALVDNLGTPGTSRFLNLIEPCTGNYTLERQKWIDSLPDIDTLTEQIRQSNKEVVAENKRIANLKIDICGNRKSQPTRVREISDQDLYRLGLEFLSDKLGPGGMSHFLRVCEPKRGIYAVDRYKNPKLIGQNPKAEQKRAS
jgi:hypothetical protein